MTASIDCEFYIKKIHVHSYRWRRFHVFVLSKYTFSPIDLAHFQLFAFLNIVYLNWILVLCSLFLFNKHMRQVEIILLAARPIHQ